MSHFLLHRGEYGEISRLSRNILGQHVPCIAWIGELGRLEEERDDTLLAAEVSCNYVIEQNK